MGNPWQRVIQYAGAHMHESPDEGALDRGLKHLSGHLPASAPYVLASLQALEPGDEVVAQAISPTGTTALVVSRRGSGKSKHSFSLLTWSLAQGLREKTLCVATKSPSFASLSFVPGSDDPVVILGKHLVWGATEVTLPWELPPGDSQVVRWMEDGRERICYRDKSIVVDMDVGAPTDIEGLRWIGVVGDSLAMIGKSLGRDRLWWRDLRVSPASPEERIILRSLKDDGTGIRFVTGGLLVGSGHDHVPCGYFSTPVGTAGINLPHGEVVITDDARVLIMGVYGPLYEFDGEEVERFAEPARNLLPSHKIRGWKFGDRVVLAGSEPHRESLRWCTMHQGVGTVDGHFGRCTLALERFHHGMGAHVRDYQNKEVLRWQIPTARDSEPSPLVFPLYGLPFAGLTAVTDARGIAIMGAKVEGMTLHVVRYPLPNAR